MASKFHRNRAPGWQSSDDEEPSEEGEATSSDEESDEHSSSKRSRTNDEVPIFDLITNKPGIANVGDGKPAGRKVNSVWSEVLVDQQLSSGLFSGASVMSGDTFVPRGSETYDCRKPKEAGKTNSEETKEADASVSEEAVDKKEVDDDDPFSDNYVEAPDLMADAAARGKFGRSSNFGGGNRKRPWNRAGGKRWTRDGDDMEEGDSRDQSVKELAQGGDRRGQRRGGRGRGRGHFDGNRSHSGSRRRLQKIWLDKGASLGDIALAISKSLHEAKTELMIRAVQNIGVDKAIRIYSQTVDIENAGGKMTLDGRRRRTSGGVFLYLVREDPDITEAQKEAVFGAEKEEYRKQLLAKRRLGKKEEGESTKMEAMEDEKPLKEAKELFLEETSKIPKPEMDGCGGVKTDDVQMDN